MTNENRLIQELKSKWVQIRFGRFVHTTWGLAVRGDVEVGGAYL